MSFTELAALALAAQGAALPPTGKWLVEYNEGDCTMSRPFGDAAKPVTFAFQPSPTGALGSVALLLPPNGRSGVRRGKGTVVMLPSGRRFGAQWAMGPLADGRRGVRFQADQGFWDALPGATAMRIELGSEPPFTVALGAMKGPLTAIKTCSDDLLRTWGAEPGAIARIAGSPGQYFSDDAYPTQAIRRHEQGRTTALATVDRDGRPTACRTVKTQASPALDKVTCEILMRNVRFEKAAPDGPAQRWAVLPVTWVLP